MAGKTYDQETELLAQVGEMLKLDLQPRRAE